MKNSLRKNLAVILAGFMVFSIAFTVWANGGDQRVGDGYLISLSRAPFTPVAGIRTAMLASFVDLKTNQLIKDDILVSVRIAEGRGSKAFIHEKEDILVQGGILEYPYTFQNSGLYEIFFDFKFANDPAKKVHELPDFLLDVQKQDAPQVQDDRLLFLVGIAGLLVGFTAGLLAAKRLYARTKRTI